MIKKQNNAYKGSSKIQKKSLLTISMPQPLVINPKSIQIKAPNIPNFFNPRHLLMVVLKIPNKTILKRFY